MSEDSKIFQLIVRQRPVAHPELEVLLQELQERFGLDIYTARQKLTGPGLALFGRGAAGKTAKIAALLHLYGFLCWQIEPQKPAFVPDLLRSLEITETGVIFACQKGSVRLERGARVVGVLADLSGGLADKHVKRLLAQNAYRGSNALKVLSRDEMIRIILQGQPIFDFYLLDESGHVQQAVQSLPGRFNVDGLGGRASLSSRQNLQALVKLVEEYAGSFTLHCDFGLSQLPGCEVRKAGDSPGAAMENLVSLRRYGWLVTQLQGDGRSTEGSTSRPGNPLRDGILLTAGMLSGTAASLPPSGSEGSSSDWTAAASELDMADAAGADRAADMVSSGPPARGRDLPPPPDPPAARPQWGRIWAMGAAAAAGLLVAVGGGDGRLWQLAVRYGLDTGAIPALAALALGWSGLHFLLLKRLVANTPTSKVRSVAMGLVEVHGRARRLYALVAPMTQSACVWYRLRKYRKNSKNNWKLSKEVNSSHVPFLLDDGTGKVTIDPSGASVRAKVQQSGFPGQSALTFTAFGTSYDEDEKWVEDIIYEGTTIYVLGYARPQNQQRLSLGDRVTLKLRQLKLDPQAMRRYDTNQDGLVDQQEWQAARNEAEQDVLAEHLAESSSHRRQEDFLVIGKGSQRSLPFIITETVAESALVRKYGLIGSGLAITGLGSLIVAFYKFLEYLGLLQ